MTTADLSTRTAAAVTRIRRLHEAEAQEPPLSARAATLAKVRGERQQPEGQTVCEWLGVCKDLDTEE